MTFLIPSLIFVPFFCCCFNVLGSSSSADTNILTRCQDHQCSDDIIYTFLFPSPLPINWKMTLAQVATAACLGAFTTLTQLSVRFIWSVWAARADTKDGKFLGIPCCQALFQQPYVQLQLTWVEPQLRDWTMTPLLQLSWLWVPHHHLPWPRQFPPSARLAFPTPLSHSHASCCPPQDPATPTQSKIKPGSPSQDPPPWHSTRHACIYFSPSTGGGLCSTIIEQQDDLKLVNLAYSSSVGKGRSAVFTERFKKQDIYLTVLPWHVFPAYEKSKL